MFRLPLTVVAVLLALPLAAAENLDVGLSDRGALISGSLVASGSRNAPTVLLIGGMSGDEASTALVRNETAEYEKLPPRQRKFRLIAIAAANPDTASLAFPPTGTAYRDNATAHVLWRWIGVHGPDLVLIAGDEDFGLATALRGNFPADVDSVPARKGVTAGELSKLSTQPIAPSPAHFELDRRIARSPREVADGLSQNYGRSFDQPWYIDGMALIAQLRLRHLDDVKRLAEPYASGAKNSLAQPNSLILAGHLVFAELARRTGDPRYTALVKRAADLGFESDGRMKEAMPYHDEYSDSLFMGTAILAQAGSLTRDRKYFDMAARHIAFMQKLVLRPDGLYRHSPLTDAAWGRGNAFPAIGLALTLSEFPEDHPERARILKSFQDHMKVLAGYQDRDGLWRNVIDHPGAYPEVSATAMIGFSMLRGVRRGWLPAKDYQPAIDAAWRAVNARTGAKGSFVDACESTTKMKSLEEYLRRAALLGPDPRAGGMVMLFATEMAGLK